MPRRVASRPFRNRIHDRSSRYRPPAAACRLHPARCARAGAVLRRPGYQSPVPVADRHGRA
ncbi:hypothetical protein DB817_07450, partial [Xanthomonas perforans]